MDTLQVPSISSHKAKKSPNKESMSTSSNRNRILPSLSEERRNNDRESNIKSGNSSGEGHPSSKQRMSSLTLKHKNSLIVVMAILIIFTVCLCPIMIGLFLHDVCGNSCGVTDDTLRTIISFSIVQAFSNCIIYVVRNRPFREQLKKLCCWEILHRAQSNSLVDPLSLRFRSRYLSQIQIWTPMIVKSRVS